MQKKKMKKTEQNSLPIHPKDVESLVALVKRLHEGDRTAAEALVDRFYRQIYLYLRKLGFGTHQSEDLTQETFMRAWNSLSQLHDERAVSAWLYRIAGNAAREQWRIHKRRHELERRPHEGNEMIALDETLSSTDQKEQHERILSVVNTLNWKLREAVVLHYLQGLTIAEAAEIAGIKEGTLKSRLHRALAILRGRIGLD